MKIMINATMIQSEGGVALLRALIDTVVDSEETSGGEETVCLYLNPALVKRLDPGSPVRIVPFRPASGWARFWWEQITLPNILKKEKYDRLISVGNTGPLFPGCPQTLYVQQSIPFSSYQPPDHRLSWQRFRLIYGFLMALAQLGSDRIVVPTRWLVSPMRKWVLGLIPETRYVVSLPGPPDVCPEGELCEKETALLSQLSQWHAQGVALLFYPAYLAPYKHLPYLFESMAMLRQRFDGSFRLILTFDEQSPEYFPCRAAVFEAYRRAGLSENEVLFCGGLSRTAVNRIYGLSRLLVFPSQVETLGLPLMESMSCSLPIVACETPFAREICADSALYAPSDQPSVFADQIAGLLKDPARCEAFAKQAENIASKWSWADHARAVLGPL